VLADPVVAARPMADLIQAGGKRVRPALVLLSARLGRYDFGILAPAALAVELIHAATLVHDDVIDGSDTRRGRPTVMATQGASAAIVVGDFYFAKAHREASRTGSPQVVDLLAAAVMRVCHGELQQQQARFHYRISVERYLRRIQLKTAALVAASCAVGAVLGELDSGQRARLTRYGSRLGMAFQMADDVLDYTGSAADLGKPVGQDLLEGHATLPLLLTYDQPGGDEVKALLEEGGGPDPETVARVVEMVRQRGATELALARAREAAAEARWELAALPDGPAREALEALAGYVVERNA
jgi:heptaprenyl diphosphate synthase